ncbi:hypothetical protein EUX98_g8551 [Antrodiella citrinella]|uniref:Uncharacterized protein n=1 Tax=Antrodiella citrinella TaxID=2447956 RepID=A0A4S4M5S4_9APHY|nr:hypothetical protein EUX98_g8551 [Antrodiella citrinella]
MFVPSQPTDIEAYLHAAGHWAAIVALFVIGIAAAGCMFASVWMDGGRGRGVSHHPTSTSPSTISYWRSLVVGAVVFWQGDDPDRLDERGPLPLTLHLPPPAYSPRSAPPPAYPATIVARPVVNTHDVQHVAAPGEVEALC